MSEITSLCHICGSLAKESCRMCGRPACHRHIHSKGICDSCIAGRKQGKATLKS